MIIVVIYFPFRTWKMKSRKFPWMESSEAPKFNTPSQDCFPHLKWITENQEKTNAYYLPLKNMTSLSITWEQKNYSCLEEAEGYNFNTWKGSIDNSKMQQQRINIHMIRKSNNIHEKITQFWLAEKGVQNV